MVGNFIVQPIVLYAVLWLLHVFVDEIPAPVKALIIAAMWIYFAVSAVGVWVSARRNISKPVWREKMWGWAARCVVLLLAITTWAAILLDEKTWH